MGEMEIAPWLKTLPLAPEYRPTEAEFADPIAYILKIEEEARMYGVCKIIPPYSKASKKTVAFHLNRSLAMSRDTVSSSKMHGSCPSMSRSMGGVMAGPQFVKLKTSPLDVSGTDSSGKAKFDTRRQQVGWNPKKTRGVANWQTHKLVWESGEKYTLEQFEQKAKLFSRQRLGTCKDVPPLAVESLFWKAATDKHISVEYANDIPGSAFAEPLDSSLSLRGKKRKRGIDEADQGNGLGFRGDESFPTDEVPGAEDELDGYDTMRLTTGSMDGLGESGGSAGSKLANSAWNMRSVARSQGSLLRYMPDEVPGVTSPMVYIGMLFSWFAWHVEDHELHSLNYLHTGASKTWYAVPGDAAPALEEAVRVHGYGGQLNARAAFSLLGEKTTVMSPEVLVAAGVPCCRLVQNAGEYVVTFPRAYHLGFSHGFNCGEAANFATPGWLDVAKDAAARRAAMNYLPMLSHQQLLYLLTMSIPPRMRSSSPSEPRSSRLKVRKKSPGEEMVKNIFVNDVIHNNRLLGLLLDKGVPCCLLANDAVNHGAANIPALEYSEQRLRPPSNNIPVGECVQQAGDSMNVDTASRAVILVTQAEDIFDGNQVSSAKLVDSTLDLLPSRSALPADAGANDGLPAVEACSASELPGPSTECVESKTAPFCGDSSGSSSSLAIDWGILPCAACGILCYATMAVVEPSSKALLIFKSLPTKPLHPAAGLSSRVGEEAGARTESVGFAADSRASMNQGLNLACEIMASSGQPEYADGGSEHGNRSSAPAHVHGRGTPVAEIEQSDPLGDAFTLISPTADNSEAPKSGDDPSAKTNPHIKEDDYAKITALVTSELKDEHVLTSEVNQQLKTRPAMLEASTELRTAGYQVMAVDICSVAEQAKSGLAKSRGIASGSHNVMVVGEPSAMETSASELKSSTTVLSSLQLLVSTYDEDSSDVEGEGISDDKIDDWETDETCQIISRPDNVGGHLLSDFVGLSADVSWLCLNPIVLDTKGPPATTMNSPSYTLDSLVDGPENLQSVFTSGGFAFVEEDRLVDLETLERILHEKENLQCGKDVTTYGSSAGSECCEGSSDAIEDQKVDDMQELYRRINSQALNSDVQDDDLVLIDFETSSDVARWQAEPSGGNDVISGAALKREAETSKRCQNKYLGASYYEPGNGGEMFATKGVASLTPSSMVLPGIDCSFGKVSYNACHEAVGKGIFSGFEGKSSAARLECRISEASDHGIGSGVSYYSGLPCSSRQRRGHMSFPTSHCFAGSDGRSFDDSTPQTCSSLDMESCPTDPVVGRVTPERIGDEKAPQVPLAGVRQRSRGGVGRPRVLCLEHAVEAQKRLEGNGGANILIVCHSGFQDYELRAKDIAQELGIEHAWREISFSRGSEDEIQLVKMAVEVEENDDYGYTDWISQLGMLVHPRFTIKESEAFDSFKRISGAFRAGPFKKGKPGRPPGSNLMAGRLGISRKRADDLKTYSSSRTAVVDLEGQLRGSKKKKCMVAGKWCGKVWRINQVHPLLGGCRSFDLPPQMGVASTALVTSNFSSEAMRVGFMKGPPITDGPLSSVAMGVEDSSAKRRGRQKKMMEHGKDQISEDSSLGTLRIHSVPKSCETRILEQGKDQVSEDSSGMPPRDTELYSTKDWKVLEQAKDQGSEDSSLGPTEVQLVASKKTSSVADSGGGLYSSMLPQESQCKSRKISHLEENADKKEGCSPLEGAEPASYSVDTNVDGFMHSAGCSQPMPLATYDPVTTDEKNKYPTFVFHSPTAQRNSVRTVDGAGDRSGVEDDCAPNELSDGVIPLEGGSCVLPSTNPQLLGPSQSDWQMLSELQQDAVGKENGGPPDSPQVHSRGSLTESSILATDAVGQQPTPVEAIVPTARGSSDPGSVFYFNENGAKDGDSRDQRLGKQAAVWCDVPIASSPSWTAAGSGSLRTDPPVHPPSVHPTHNSNQIYFASCSDQAEETGYGLLNNAVRPAKGKFLQKYGVEDPISGETHETALKMRKMLDFERPQTKRSSAEVMSTGDPVNDVESITTSKLLGGKRKSDGFAANTCGKKVKSFDNGKNLKFQEELDTLDPSNDKVVALVDEVSNAQELCESSCHPGNELEQFDYEDDGSQHTLRDIKYVYGVSDSRGEFLVQAEGFVGEDTSGDHLPAEQIAEDQGSCVPLTMLDSQVHDCGSQKLHKSRVPYPSRTSQPDDSAQCASGVHPLDLLPIITSNRGKPLGKTRGKRSKPLKQIWTSLKHSQLDRSFAEKSGGRREVKFDTQMNSSEIHNLQSLQCVEARFEAEDCDRGPDVADHPLGRTLGQGTRLRARGPPAAEPDSEEDGEEPKMTPEKAKKKGRPKKKKVVGRKPKDEEDKEFQCDLDGCRMSFATEAELNIHKKNRCTFKGCNKSFFMHKYLLQHRRVHQPDRPLKCPWAGCPQSFKWAWARTEHIRVHTGERPYTCPDCDQTFRFVSDFSRHKRNTGHTKG